MLIRGLFIGVDRHADRVVPELTGARRDALFLWSVFRDTFPELDGRVLVDEEALAGAVGEQITRLLQTAGNDDTVILTFSGHGTYDHRLVCYDTTLAALDETTISMEYLARFFRESRARNILLVLDCCFSGGARAKVLSEAPIPRDIDDPVRQMAGKGRFLITACAVNEEAFELPKERHGLLTYHLGKGLVGEIDGTVSEGTLSVPALVDRVATIVSAEAKKIGGLQTPTYIGEIEGGLIFPVFRRGEEFARRFPETLRPHVTATIDDLQAFNLPREILEAWKSEFQNGLNTLQIQSINDFGALSGDHLVVIAPTSSGKTFIGEMAAVRAVQERRKALFLLPYKALVNEKYDRFSVLYGRVGLRVIRSTGDHSDQNDELARGQFDICLMTYEMCLQMLLSNEHILSRVGLVVIDETQFISDESRGLNLELLMSLLVYARQRSVEPQLILLSAVIGGVNHLDSWLNARVLLMRERPVPLIEGVIDRSGVYEHRDQDGAWKIEQMLQPHEVRQRKEKPSCQDLLVPLVRRLVVGTDEKILIFRNQRAVTQGCARYLAEELGLAPVTVGLQELPDRDLSDASRNLRFCLEHGVGFHNTNLTPGEKMVVERHFRDPASPLRLVIATSTLAAGINTPASTVIIVEREFEGGDKARPFTVAEYKNMAGRAGRLGFREVGKAISYSEGSHERSQVRANYIDGALGEFRSAFDDRDLTTLILRLLCQVRKVPRADMAGLLSSTYGGYLNALRDPNWGMTIAADAGPRIDRLLQLGLVEEDGEGISLTLLGRVCGEVGLEIHSALRVIEAIRRLGPTHLTPEATIAILQAVQELDEIYTPMNRRARSEKAEWPARLARQLGAGVTGILQRDVAGDEIVYVARCKRALISLSWFEGMPIETIERQFSTNQFFHLVRHGDVRRIVDRTRMFVASVHRLAAIISPEGTALDARIDQTITRLEFGIPERALSLLALGVPLDRGQLLALAGAGLTSVGALRQASEEVLRGILGVQLALRVSEAARRARSDEPATPSVAATPA